MDDSKRPRRSQGRPPRPSLSPVVSKFTPAEEADAPDDDEGVSLEELSQSYQRVLGGTEAGAVDNASATPAQADQLAGLASSPAGTVKHSGARDPDDFQAHELQEIEQFELDEDAEGDAAECPLNPQSILEAILFVGRPDGSPISAAEIAALMRGVQAAEVIECIDQLNQIYIETQRATRIVASGTGYRLQLADDLNYVRDRFYGRVRQVKLNQAAIDCLALISYQPGISREKLEEQRGQASGSLLAQLIRRQLLEMRRETEGKKQVQRYYPTDRLLDLAGIESLDDLPLTEDFD